ncbi:hypothetical protein [Pediococcus pentosaceus]|uniref:hypothetical protein n=1 Tax=Pediococcus pentosaceus TaxID=1255 RepID=UPI001DD89676|nr:hypothetical protein [Pediococcus pentosaceus]MBF7137894.1 hypothetical protein [Pediococcus pentosaceus]
MKNKLIHLGLPIPGLSEQLKENFDYIDIPFEKLWEPNAKKRTSFYKRKIKSLIFECFIFNHPGCLFKGNRVIKKVAWK